LPWSVRGTKGSFVPLRERGSGKQRLTEQKGGGRMNSVFNRSESATNKSSSDSSTEQEKGIGRAAEKFDRNARRFSLPLIVRQGSIQRMPVHLRDETGRLVKEMI
jgi:hypothetical protein